MNEQVDSSAEPWPFFNERGKMVASVLPPLTVVKRQSPEPPPPTVVKHPQDANTAPRSDDQAPGNMLTPPPLKIASKGRKTARPEVAQIMGYPEPTTDPGESKGPPPLEIRKIEPKVKPEPPKLEARQLAPVVYLLVGKNLLTEEIHLCHVISEAGYRRAERRGEGELLKILGHIVVSDRKRLLNSSAGEAIKDHRDSLSTRRITITPQRAQLGVVYEAELLDHYYEDHLDRNQARGGEEGEDEDEDEGGGYAAGPEKVYSWAVIRCDLKGIPRINLSAILS